MDRTAVRYSVLPSVLLQITDPLAALDFNIAMMVISSRIEKGEPITFEEVKQREASGFEAIRALQESVQQSYEK